MYYILCIYILCILYIIYIILLICIYKSSCRKHQRGETWMQQHLYEHFCNSNHDCFISDVLVIFIDKTDPSDALQKKDYWKSTLKTMAPFGLNVEKSVWRSLFLISFLRCTWSGNVGREEVFLKTSCWALSEFEHMYVLGLWLWTTIFISFNTIVVFIITVIVIFITIIIIFMAVIIIIRL